jgi:hypothetical protein
LKFDRKSGDKSAALQNVMLVREYRELDLAQLRAIHAAQGFDYALPDLTNPLFVTKLLLTDGLPQLQCDTDDDSRATGHEPRATNRVVGAALLRLTAEAYLLLDPRAGTPRQRWQWLLALHAATEQDAWRRGLEDVHAWLPPPIAGKFGKRLARLGWQRDDTWTPYCRKLSRPRSSD